MTRLIEPNEHIVQAIIRSIANDGTIYRVDEVINVRWNSETEIRIEAVNAGRMIIVSVKDIGEYP